MHRWTALAVLATGQFLVVLSTSIVNVALPAIRSGLGLTPAGLSWVVNAYGLAFGALLLLGGAAADLLGRRRVLVAGLTGFAVTSLAAGLAWTPEILITARAIQGVSAAALAPAALSLVLTLFPEGRERGTALGVWGGVSGAGGAAGVLLSGVLTDLFGWPAIFYAAVPVAVAAIVAAYRFIPADPGRKPQPRPDLAGAITVTAGLITITYALAAKNLVWIPGVLLLAAFVVIQRKARNPLVPGRVVARRSVATANITMTVLGAVWVGLFYFLPLYQQQVLGYSPMKAGLTQLPLAVTIIVGSTVAPRLPAKASLIASLLVLAVSLAWFGQAPTELVGPSLLAGAGLGIAFVHLTTLAGRGVPAADAGLASGLINTTRQIGGALGLAALTGSGAPFLALAALAVAATLIATTTPGESA
jgi:EmrB/QacA subfamily drug resistance transporter